MRTRSRVVRIAVRCLLALAVFAALATGIAGGLVRAGVALPERASSGWLTHAVMAHAFLWSSAFFGTVISSERAVAVKNVLAFGAPLASGLAGGLMLIGAGDAARWVAVAAAATFVGVNVQVFVRQHAAHTALLLIAALAWLSGSLLFAASAPPESVVPWWFAFLVLTIAAERLEMTRLMRRRAGASQALYAVVGTMLLGCALGSRSAMAGGVMFGFSLFALALWLLRFDVARRTIKATGLSRYMAVCLLLGYGWLAIAGLAWIANSLGLPWRDAALHALALGFVFSMMLAHAPVIAPAILHIKLRFGWAFYLPLALLHGSLALRLAAGHVEPAARAAGATGNALSIVLFAATLAGAAVAWQLSVRAARGSQAARLRAVKSTHPE